MNTSEPRDSLDAYQPPAEVEAEIAQPGRRRRGLTLIAVVAIVLGIMGLINAVTGVVGLAFGSQIQSTFGSGGQIGQLPPELEEIQKELQQDTLLLQHEFWWPSAAAVLVHLVVAAGLLAGGIQTHRRIPAGPRILSAACCLAIPFELLARGVLQTMIQFRTATMLKQQIQRVVDEAAGQIPPAAERLLSLPYVMILGAIFVLVGLMLLKVVYYAITIWYLRRPSVRAEFNAAES